jgi:hypothetical protein
MRNVVEAEAFRSEWPAPIVTHGRCPIARASIMYHSHFMGQQQVPMRLLGAFIVDDLAQPYVEDTVMVAPGQRVDVLIDASETGIWALHSHTLDPRQREPRDVRDGDGLAGPVIPTTAVAAVTFDP